MRWVKRVNLPSAAITYLRKRQKKANAKLVSGNLDTDSEWNSARKTKSMGKVLTALVQMAGKRQRCMFCLDSHGSGIEHFRPKAKDAYPKRMFSWRNLLLCCSKCGTLKGNQFPLQGKRPLLIDPSKEEPWRYLDYDSVLGIIIPRFDPQANAPSSKGVKTVQILKLDQREGLEEGHKKTCRRLKKTVQKLLSNPNMPMAEFIEELQDADEQELLGWCFIGTGQDETPFKEFKQKHPSLWQYCARALGY